jgi:hypothetical protein
MNSKILCLGDLVGYTEDLIKAHLAESYSGDDSGFDYGCPTEEDIAVVAKTLEDYDVLIAYESVGAYGCDSSSWFLLQSKETGKFFTASGSHCSCYGFEGQFDLEESPLEYLQSDNFEMGTGGYDVIWETNKSLVKQYLQLLTERS